MNSGPRPGRRPQRGRFNEGDLTALDLAFDDTRDLLDCGEGS